MSAAIEKSYFSHWFRLNILFLGLLMACHPDPDDFGETEILPWYDGKKMAISITYDDGTVNQFQKALPIMNELGMPGTFYINTGEIPGSQYQAKFIGRELKEIVEESASVATDRENLFERASAIRMIDMSGAVEMHNQAGALFEQGKEEEAIAVVEKALAQARGLNQVRERTPRVLEGPRTDWDAIREFASQGHEFGVHTISHPRLAVMDEDNLLYELLNCREDILNELGPEHTFSAECPFGTEDERVMEYALAHFEGLRNIMPMDSLHEVNRWGHYDPTYDQKPYVQWQRGPLGDTTLTQKKAWVDRALDAKHHPWLVLVYHGIDGLGWEPQSSDSVRAYFEYIHGKDDQIWVGTFKEVTQYLKQRMAASVDIQPEKDQIIIYLTHNLGERFDHPMTLRTQVPGNWDEFRVLQGGQEISYNMAESGATGQWVHYNVLPNAEEIVLEQVR